MCIRDSAPLALELACWGASDPQSLAWLDPPPLATLTQAKELLHRLEAIDERGQATPSGRRMASLGTHPRLAHKIWLLYKSDAVGDRSSGSSGGGRMIQKKKMTVDADRSEQ